MSIYTITDLDPAIDYGRCYYCLDALNSDKRIVAHAGGGKFHPLHFECLEKLTGLFLKCCPICKIETDAENVFKENQSFFSRIKEFINLNSSKLIELCSTIFLIAFAILILGILIIDMFDTIYILYLIVVVISASFNASSD